MFRVFAVNIGRQAFSTERLEAAVRRRGMPIVPLQHQIQRRALEKAAAGSPIWTIEQGLGQGCGRCEIS